jgi:hypothetical protein
MVLTPEIRETVSQIHQLLLDEGDRNNARVIESALHGPAEALGELLVSNELWGGSGSIADYALLNSPRRRDLEQLLIHLGRLQLEMSHINVRTQMWVSAFESWHARGLS